MLAKKVEDKTISRREFMDFTWAATLVALVGQAGAALIRFLTPPREEGAFGSQVRAGKVDEFETGTVSHVQSGRFYISRLEDGSFLALWHRCTHLGCTIPWKEQEGRFHCPCHSSIFTREGVVVSGPAPRPMDIFPIEIIEGEIIVNTGQPITRDRFDPSQATQV